MLHWGQPERPLRRPGYANEAVSQCQQGRFEGSIPLYEVTVNLELEGRGMLKRIPGKQHRV